MSHLVGYVHCSYADLVAAFGPSQCWDNFKAVYVYNYKNGPNYLGEEGAPVEGITEWHIGGDTNAVVPLIQWAIATGTRPAVGSAS